jgi:hypothetical protein
MPIVWYYIIWSIGRHRGLQAKERICKLCLKEVVDEIHLLKCEALQNVRTPFICQKCDKFK